MRRFGLLLLLAGPAACIDESQGFVSIFIDPTQSNVDFVERGDDLHMQVDAEMFIDAFGEGTIHIDGATLVTTVDGVATTFDDPVVTTEDFPIEGQATGIHKATFEIPSPIDDHGSFESFCASNARTVLITVRFYATQNDRKGEEAPPLQEAAAVLPLIPTSAPPTSDVFEASGVLKFSTQTMTQPVYSISPDQEGNVLFVVQLSPGNISQSIPGSYRVYRGDGDSIATAVEDFSSFFDLPSVTSKNDGGLAFGARSGLRSISVRAFAMSGGGQSYADIQADSVASPEYEALRLALLARSEVGVDAIVQSAFPLLLADGVTTVAPPEGKYYGSFRVELAEDLVMLNITPLERDVVSQELLEDGTTLRASTDLPPREGPATLLVEHLDIAGVPIWTHEEPVLVYSPAVRPLQDGGALVAFEEEEPGGRIQVLRLSGTDGTVLYRYTALGSAPSIAARSDGGALVSFVGNEPTVDLPNRFVPLLVELSSTGEVLRGAQLGCGGQAAVVDVTGGNSILAGALTERFALGSTTTELVLGDLILSVVE